MPVLIDTHLKLRDAHIEGLIAECELEYHVIGAVLVV